jgi:hypothetical protein
MTRRDASPLPLAALVTVLLFGGLFVLAGGLASGSQQRPETISLGAGGTRSVPAHKLPAQPLAFEPAARGDSYLVRGTQYELTVGASGTRLYGRGGDIRTQLTGARAASSAPANRQTMVVNRYQGAKSDWRTGIPTFGRVAYRGVYPGIDLAYHGRSGTLEYDFIVKPGADPGRIGLSVSGAGRVRIDANGNLVASSGDATLRQHRPVAYQEIAGKRQRVDARFVLRGNRVAFELGRYDRSRELVIDPTLTYGDYIGGSRDDAGTRVAVDSSGNIYVVGYTNSTSITGTSGSRSGTSYDAFVLRIAPDHSRTWISYLGGSSDDSGTDIGLDSQGRPYISGSTKSDDFPDGDTGTGLYGSQDAFTAAFATNGLLRWANTWGTGISGSAVPSTGYAIAVEGGGTTYTAITGAGATDTDGQIIQWSSDGSSGFYIFPDGMGTDLTDSLTALGVKPGCASNCDVYFAGHVTRTFECDGNVGNGDETLQLGYIGAYNFHTGANVWGGAGYNYYLEECAATGKVEVAALDVSNAGDPTIAGQVHPNSGSDHTFFARYAGSNGYFDPMPFGASLTAASASTDVSHDAQDNLLLVGWEAAKTGDFQGAIQPDYNGGLADGTVLKIFTDGPAITSDPGGSTPHERAAIVFATLFGGSATDLTGGVAGDGSGNIFFTGSTISLSKFPTQSTTQSPGIAGSLGDGFIGIIRPTIPQITGGPSGLVHSRDAKFTLANGPEPGFNYSAEEVGAKLECRLSPRDANFGPCPDTYGGLGDGSYTFQARSVDTGGTASPAASRDFQVDATLAPRFSIAPNPALVGRPVTFDASGTTGLPVAKYEWDLDGNGSFETNSAGNATVTQSYPGKGSFNVGLKVTDVEGHTATTTNTLQVNDATGPGSQFGVTINDGAQFTNDPNVVVTATFPSFTSGLLFSNDGGFGKAQTFAAKKETNWKLDSSGPERLPKTIYVRFLTGSIASNSYQDDIILDETPPKVDEAVIDSADGEASSDSASAARLKKYKVRMKARDKTSGVSKVQVTANKRKPGKALKYKRKFTVKSAKRPKWVRARDRAGNWSKWKKAR